MISKNRSLSLSLSLIKSGHNFNLDFIKCLSIIGVVFLHIADGYFLRADYYGSGLTWYLLFIIRVLAGASVPIFIMSSGYLTIGKNYTFPQLLKRVVVRLFIPFLFLFILTTWLAGVSAAHLHDTSLHTSLPNLVTDSIKVFTAYGSLHFLVALIGLNLLLPVWSLIFSKSEERNNFRLAKYLIIVDFVIAFTAVINLNFNPNLTSHILNEWRWLLWVGYFLLGYLIKVKPGLITKKIAVIMFIIGFLGSFIINFITRKLLLTNPGNNFIADLANLSLDYQSLWVVLMGIGAWVILLKTNFQFLQKTWQQKIVNLGASLCMGIYIFHGLIYTFLDVFQRVGLDNMIFWHRPAFAVIGLTLLTIAISAVLTFIFSLIPALRLLIGNDKKPRS